MIYATMGNHRIYEYLARYPAGLVGVAMQALRDELSRCARPAEGEEWKVLAADDAGLLILRSYDDGGDETAAYYVGMARDYLVAVLVIGTRTGSGDPTIASGLGTTALARAGRTGTLPYAPRHPVTVLGRSFRKIVQLPGNCCLRALLRQQLPGSCVIL